MHTTTSSHRVVKALTTSSVTALAALCLAAPAQAEGTGGDEVVSPADVRVWENENSMVPTPRLDAPRSDRPLVTVDDNAVEYVQVGLGALGGMALVGAAAAAVSASHRRQQAHPA